MGIQCYEESGSTYDRLRIGKYRTVYFAGHLVSFAHLVIDVSTRDGVSHTGSRLYGIRCSGNKAGCLES